MQSMRNTSCPQSAKNGQINPNKSYGAIIESFGRKKQSTPANFDLQKQIQLVDEDQKACKIAKIKQLVQVKTGKILKKCQVIRLKNFNTIKMPSQQVTPRKKK